MAIYSLIGLFIKSFEVIVKSVVIFLVTYLDSEILKDIDISHPPSCFIIRSILRRHNLGRLYKTCSQLSKF